MVMFLLLGVILVGTAVTLLAFGLKPATTDLELNRSLAVLEAMTSAPKELTADLDRPFSERVLEPLQARALGLGRRITGADAAERIRHKLDLAGNPAGWTVDRVVSFKVLGSAAGLLIGVLLGLLFGASFLVAVVVAVFTTVVGFFGPNLYLYQRAYDRSEKLRRELPDAIDLMTISVEAGLGFDAAVQQVANNTVGPLAEEFSRMLREMQLGKGRADALRGLSTRCGVDDVKSFVGAMVQADGFGIPIAQVLRVQAQEMRVKRRQNAERRAQQVPVKITIPLIFFVLPCLFVPVMGPAVINMLNNFK